MRRQTLLRDTSPTAPTGYGSLVLEQRLEYPQYYDTSTGGLVTATSSPPSVTLTMYNTASNTSATTDNLWSLVYNDNIYNYAPTANDTFYDNWSYQQRHEMNCRRAAMAAESQWGAVERCEYSGRREPQVNELWRIVDDLAEQVGAASPEAREERERVMALERQRREEILARQREEQRVISEQREKAQKRAEDLLLSCLTEEQRQMYHQAGKFRIVGSNGSIYEIRKGRQHNIFKLDAQGNLLEELCVHPGPRMPDPDTMLLQKVSLETDEDEMRRIANIWRMSDRQLISQSSQPA